MDHLNPESQKKALLSDAERISFIRERIWIPYAKANEIIDLFTDYLDYPKNNKMPNYVLIGQANNGKTELLLEFAERYKPKNVPGLGRQLDVAYICAPPAAEETRLYNEILIRFNAAFSINDNVANKLDLVEKIISEIGLKMLIIDEIHNVIASSYQKQRKFLMTLKTLANKLKIIIICAGNSDAQTVMTADDQITTRFEEILLPSWKENPKEFAILFKNFTQVLPLREPTNYKDKDLLAYLFDMGEGLLGEYAKILRRAAEHAIKTKTEKITIDILKAIRYQKPSSRSGKF
ncbi:MAG: TniB family NTP-binding protein [Cyclobacteriaceae bacterium]